MSQACHWSQPLHYSGAVAPQTLSNSCREVQVDELVDFSRNCMTEYDYRSHAEQRAHAPCLDHKYMLSSPSAMKRKPSASAAHSAQPTKQPQCWFT